MFLSKLDLNPNSRQVRSELENQYQMHRTLSRGFGDDNSEYEQARCLFRVDESLEGGLSLLVQSHAEPDWEFLRSVGGYLVSEPLVKPYEPNIECGQRLRFRLRANPSVKRDGKRHGLLKDDERMKWLNRKASENGFSIMRAEICAIERHTSRCRNKPGVMVHLGVMFEGILEVIDPELFRHALESGIGSAKGFGFGLLSIAPVRRG